MRRRSCWLQCSEIGTNQSPISNQTVPRGPPYRYRVQVHVSRAARPAHRRASCTGEDTETPDGLREAPFPLTPDASAPRPHLFPVHHTTLHPCPQCGARQWLKASPPRNAHPVGIGMAGHPRRSWSSRRTQDDQRPPPPSSAVVVAQQGVLLPIPLQRQDAERVTIDLARATVPESPG